jgi:hypothetical protein
LTIPVVGLNASSLSPDALTDGVNSTRSVTGTCWVYFAGHWYAYPC